MIVGGQALAVVTGLADGSTQIGGWEWALVLGSLILYGVAVIEVGVGGILLSRDVFKSRQMTPVAH
jgi:hypothetical protein